MISAKEISSKRFEKSALGGYKIDEVDQFLKEIAVEIAQIQREKEDGEKKIDILADKVREFMKDEEVLKEALLGAQRQGHKVIEEAQITANRILAEANEKADHIISHTQYQLENEKTILLNMQKEVSDFKARLLSLYKSHLDLITAMPEVDPSLEASTERAAEYQEPEHTEELESQAVHNSAEAKKSQYPFASGTGSETRYTDLKFGHNSK